jgi:TPR repeat protein
MAKKDYLLAQYQLAAHRLSQSHLRGKWVERNEQVAVKWLELATKIAEQHTGG